MQLSEVMKKPVGFIKGIMHTGTPKFQPVGNGSDPKQGYLMIPKANIIQEHCMKNLIVDMASTLIAKRMRPGASWAAGIGFLEVGSGVGTGTTQSPQIEDHTQVALRQAMARKAITAWTYLDPSNNLAVTAAETNVLQLTTTFLEAEAVGAITEMGLFGGDAVLGTLGSGYMFNSKAFGVWNKQNNMQLTIVWSLTF